MSFRKRTKRAYSMVEVLVVTAVGAVVLGLVLDALIQTNRVSDELVLGQQMRQEALVIAQSVEKVVRLRIDPATGATGGNEKFLAGEMKTLSMAPAPGGQVRALETSVSTDAENGPRVVVRRAAEGGDAKAGVLGANPDRFRTEIAFRYAEEYDGLEAKWADSATSKPLVVEYTIHVWPKRKGFDRFENAQDAHGRNLGFKYTSAVKLP